MRIELLREFAQVLESFVDGLALSFQEAVDHDDNPDDGDLRVEIGKDSIDNGGGGGGNHGGTRQSSVDSNKVVSNDNHHNDDGVQGMLDDINQCYREIALFLHGEYQQCSNDYNNDDDDDDDDDDEEEVVADALLDWAMASKKAGHIQECVRAHCLRMNVCTTFRFIDAVRLLGVSSSSSYTLDSIDKDKDKDKMVMSMSMAMAVEEISNNHGLFEAVPTTVPCNTSNPSRRDCNYVRHVPSHRAIELGREVRELFLEVGYTLCHCRSFLHSLLCHKDNDNHHNHDHDDDDWNKDRLFSANSFFQHRHDLYARDLQNQTIDNHKNCNDTNDTDSSMTPFDVLVRLFLFGLGMDRTTVKTILGQSRWDLLERASLLSQWCHHPCGDEFNGDGGGGDDDSLGVINTADVVVVVGEVQVYPLAPSDLHASVTTTDEMQTHCLFMTDWPMESLRLPENAIMSVGYDTLELLALAVDGIRTTLSSYSNQGGGGGGGGYRVLDLCCGCGIQGLFACATYCYHSPPPSSSSSTTTTATSMIGELLCLDINPRAKHFVTGNACLNSFFDDSSNNSHHHRHPIVYAVRSNLYHPLDWNEDTNTTHHDATTMTTTGVQPISKKKENDVVTTTATTTTTIPTSSFASTSPPISSQFPRIGTFHCLLTNPPFVAVPTSQRHVRLRPALYAAGGGAAGTHLLQRILSGCLDVLQDDDGGDGGNGNGNGSSLPSSTVFLVTELPNIRESCEWIQRCCCLPPPPPPTSSSSSLPSKQPSKLRIRVAYVHDDVETVEDYARIRECEAGYYGTTTDTNASNADRDRDRGWVGSMVEGGVYDRALAVVSISRDRGDEPLQLHCFQNDVDNGDIGRVGEEEDDDDDAEDAFLTKRGIEFMRSALL